MDTSRTIEQNIHTWDEYAQLAKRQNPDMEERYDYLILAIRYYESAMDLPWTEYEQLQKIDIALILMELLFQVGERANSKTIEDYFYRAVNLAHTYLWETWHSSTPRWEQLTRAYLRYIDPWFQRQFRDRQVSSFTPLLALVILAESNKRLSWGREEIEKILENHWDTKSDVDIIATLENYLGPIRLSITSEGWREIIAQHHIWNDGVLSGAHVRRVLVTIFDKKKEYEYMVDRWSIDGRGQFTEGEYLDIIEPMISLYIEKREYAFFIWMIDNISLIEEHESQNTEHVPPKRYHIFIQKVLDKFPVHGWDVGRYINAIDIYREIICGHTTTEKSLEYIDRVLGWEINREVLWLVQIILLSEHETMNGGGYPYWLSKKNIPLIWRIYAIIRAYRALSGYYHCDPTQTLIKMREWCQWWYFDSDVFQIFLETISKHDEDVEEVAKNIDPITPSVHRDNVYRRYLEQWTATQSIISEICDCYIDTRLSVWDQVKLNTLFLKISKLTLTLRQLSAMRKLIIITRHGETMSDRSSDIPGTDNEVLTQEGIESSELKWKILKWLSVEIHTSPLRRAIETTDILSQTLWEYDAILIDDALRNPKKTLDNWRYNSYSQKLLVDNSGTIMDFLITLISSPVESSVLLIAHRDSIRHTIFWLNNLFVQDEVHGTKTPVENDSIYTFFFRGDHAVTGDELMQYGLIFSVENWKIVWERLISISNSVFGVSFLYDTDMPVDIIQLHDRFLDYLDKMVAKHPAKVIEFLAVLDIYPETCHIRTILESEWCILNTKTQE